MRKFYSRYTYYEDGRGYIKNKESIVGENKKYIFFASLFFILRFPYLKRKKIIS